MTLNELLKEHPEYGDLEVAVIDRRDGLYHFFRSIGGLLCS